MGKLRHKVFSCVSKQLGLFFFFPHQNNVELNLGTDVSSQSGYEASVGRKGFVPAILFSIECSLFMVARACLCMHTCVLGCGHMHTTACVAEDNLEHQFLLSTSGWGLLLVAAEHGR